MHVKLPFCLSYCMGYTVIHLSWECGNVAKTAQYHTTQNKQTTHNKPKHNQTMLTTIN